MQNKKQITFLLSVDTEEEWDWEGEFPESDFSVENLQRLPDFQQYCEGNGIRPCYFVDYPAAALLSKQTAFMQSVERSTCELGAHLHPWANPPYFGKPTESNSHVVNEDIMHLLYTRGFDIDSSVYPFYKNDYFDCYGSPLIPYWPDTQNVLAKGQQRNIIELPVTVGFNRTPFERSAKIHDATQHPLLQTCKITALLWHTNLLKKIYLSPEVSDTTSMIQLAEASIKSGHNCLHMFFHSSNLITNSTGFFKTDNAYELIVKRISKVLAHLQQRYHVQFMTPSEYKIHLSNNQDQIAL